MAFNIRSVQDLAAAQTGSALTMPLSLVRTLSPADLAIPEFVSQLDIDIAEKMYARHPKFGDDFSDLPHRHYMREIDMGNDRTLFRSAREGLPLYEGRMVGTYDHRAKGYRSGRGRKAVWEDLGFADSRKSVQPQWYIPVELVSEKTRERCRDYRVGFCDVASATNQRTLVATLIPRETICGDKVPTIVFRNGSPWMYALWLAVANSFAMDFLVRMKVSLTMSYTILDSMPFSRPIGQDESVRALVAPVLRLVCTGEEMIGFWNSAAAGGWVAHHWDPSTVPGVTDEDERRRLRAMIDAYVARGIYGLTRDELGYILDTFPIVRKHDLRRFGDYRTKAMILAAYDDLDTLIG